jgi:hypothetical protein
VRSLTENEGKDRRLNDKLVIVRQLGGISRIGIGLALLERLRAA